MKKRLASLFLLLVLAGSAFAGVPLRFGEGDCGMSMMEMDCCKAALLQKETPEVAAARLCCAVNCTQSGTATSSTNVRLSLPAQVSVPPHPASVVPTACLPLRHFSLSHGPPNDSHPAYIRHLALLI